VDPTTWEEILAAGQKMGVPRPESEALARQAPNAS